MPSVRHFKSIDKAIACLKCFTPDHQELRARDVSKMLGLHRVTTHRLLKILTEAEMLQKDENLKTYSVGPELYMLGSLYIDNTSLAKAADSIVKKINEITGEVVAVQVLEKGYVVIVMREERQVGFRWSVHPGSISPAHVVSGGKILLSELSDEEIDNIFPDERLEQLTEQTINTKENLKRELANVRQRGIAHTRDEHFYGTMSVAAAIRNSKGKTVASLVIALPTFNENKMTSENLDELVKLGANLISFRLGYRSDIDSVRNIDEMIARWKASKPE